MTYCCICKNPAVYFEPRFVYHACKEHQNLSPVQISDIVHAQKQSYVLQELLGREYLVKIVHAGYGTIFPL
jgi:hypothetical protein